MSESESFDAFYARTVSSVTSQMHALAGEDTLADHAIREAYARAYQQWYEVGRARDSEAWVLAVARDAYDRRRAEAAALRQHAPEADQDPLSWPGLFRPAAPGPTPPAAQRPAASGPAAQMAAWPMPAEPLPAEPISAAAAAAALGQEGFAPAGAVPAAAAGAGTRATETAGAATPATGAPGTGTAGAAIPATAAGSGTRATEPPGAAGPIPTAAGPGTWTAEPPGAAGPIPTAAGPGTLPAAAGPGTLPAAAGPGTLPAAAGPGTPVTEWGGAAAPPTAPPAAPVPSRPVPNSTVRTSTGAAAMPADPEATLAPSPNTWPAEPPIRPPGSLFGSPARVARPDDAIFGSSPSGAGAATTAPWHAAAPSTAIPSGRSPGRRLPPVLGRRRNLILAVAAAAIVLAGGIVYALGGNSGHGAASPGTSAGTVTKPTVHMLPAGRTGGRAAIPWSLIGPGWTLAEVSAAQPDANGAAASGGPDTIYLVDPEGGKYRITSSDGAATPELLAWSGNATTALYALGGAQAGSAPSYGLLRLSSGTLTPLPLPAGVTALGFTRPDGLNILAVRQRGGKYLLQRFTLAGQFAATIGSMPRPAGATDVLQGNALSSPDGTTAVWGVSGHEMQLVSNARGLIRRLRVPGTGTVPSCTPLSWWDAQTVLAYCNAVGTPGAGRLWLVPAGGATPTQLTGISGASSGVGDLTGGWQAGGAVYITATTSTQCPTAASGPGGQQILQLGTGGVEQPVRIPGSTGDHDSVVAGVGGRLLVLTQTSCPGTSSLVWYNPATHAAASLLTAPAGQVGVVDAVPYGSGPPATTNGLS